MATFSAPVLERTYSTSDVVEQRARIRATVVPKRGEHGLDIGCGPGLLACEMARDVGPSGRMVGIDQSADMVAMSGERARRAALIGRTEFAVGDAVELRFPSQNFDFATAIQVYEHVADLPRLLGHGGFAFESSSVAPMVNLHPDGTTYCGSLIDVVARFVSRRTGIPEDVAQAWADDVRGQDLEGRHFFSLSRFLFVAERPMTGG